MLPAGFDYLIVTLQRMADAMFYAARGGAELRGTPSATITYARCVGLHAAQQHRQNSPATARPARPPASG